METANLDRMRMDIFREIMRLDESRLKKVYHYIFSRSTVVDAKNKKVLNELLMSSVDEALGMEKDGSLCSTEAAIAKLDQEMQWK